MIVDGALSLVRVTNPYCVVLTGLRRFHDRFVVLAGVILLDAESHKHRDVLSVLVARQRPSRVPASHV
jgi:cobyrinic acid a,c-diamide synthase